MINEWLHSIYYKIFPYKKPIKTKDPYTWMVFRPKDWNFDLKKDLKNGNTNNESTKENP